MATLSHPTQTVAFTETRPLPRMLEGKRVFLVDDEADIIDFMELSLNRQGAVVGSTSEPLGALSLMRDFMPDLIVLDVMMPDMDGLMLCKLIRKDRVLGQVPVLFLSARGEVDDRVAGLTSGADDYLAKPFEQREFLLRAKALIRRVEEGGAGAQARLLSVGILVLDPDRFQAKVDGREIDLTATEFKLLRLLAERKNRVQTRENLLLNVWNHEVEQGARTVDTHIRRIREKLGEHCHLIQTVRGAGYRMVGD